MLSKYEAVEFKRVESERLLSVCRSLNVKSGIDRLQSKIKSEISFLGRLLKKPADIKNEHLRSSNLFHLSAIVKCVEACQDVDEVLKPICLSSPSGRTYRMTVDVVADYGKTWIKVVARNPQALLQSSLGAAGYGKRTLVEQIEDLKDCSRLYPYLYQVPSIKLWFAAGVDTKMVDLLNKMKVSYMGTVLESSTDFILEQIHDEVYNEFASTPDVLINQKPNTVPCRPTDNMQKDTVLEYRNFGKSKTVLSLEEIPQNATLNLDVSTLIAHVSSLTNGRCHLAFQEDILTEQAQREREASIRPVLDSLFEGRKLVCCNTAHQDFQDILNTVGGPAEKKRAKHFLSTVAIVPDQPSSEALALSISSRVKTRSRIVFGTGESLKAITVTANQGFLRAAQAQGFHFVSFLHESRALTELKEESASNIDQEK